MMHTFGKLFPPQSFKYILLSVQTLCPHCKSVKYVYLYVSFLQRDTP